MEREAEAEAAAGAVSVDLQVEEVEYLTPDISQMVPVSGGVRMNVIADKARGHATAAVGVLPALKCGDVVEAPMRLRVPERYRDPGLGSMRIICWRRGWGRMRVCGFRRSRCQSGAER